jgi:S1-C subfamily serine protease
LVTNHHVIADCEVVRIRFDGEHQEDAKVLAVDAQHDLALLQASNHSPGFAWFRSGSANGLSGSVVAVGFPNQGLPTLMPVATQGTLLRANDGLGHIIINANVRHGNSGGPIFDTGGLVIGVVDARLDVARIFTETGKQLADTGVGVAAETVVDFLRRTNTRFYVREHNAETDTRHILELARSFVARAECWR